MQVPHANQGEGTIFSDVGHPSARTYMSGHPMSVGR